MKHNLFMRIHLIFMLALAFLKAEDFNYTFNIDNTTPYKKEAIILTLDLNQTNPDVVLLFDFSIKQSKDYSFQRLNIKETDSYHNAQIHYVYLLYPLIDGDINIHFSLTKKVTTDDSVAYSFSGDRDNVKGLVTKDYQITLPPQSLHVKPLPKNTQIVGDFNLSYIIKKHKAMVHEPLPFHIQIKGQGYPPLLPAILSKDSNYTVFTEDPIIQSHVKQLATISTINYPMALSHTKDFTLEAIEIQAFNPKTNSAYSLTVPSQKFYINSTKEQSLIDNIDNPPVFTYDFTWIVNYLVYFVIFIAGYLSATIIKWSSNKKNNNPLKNKILLCKNAHTLLPLLMAQDKLCLEPYIKLLESSLYGDGKINFTKVKKQAGECV